MGYSEFTPEIKARLAFIEGREDLVETQVMRLPTQAKTENGKNILLITRDPGSANALSPVITELLVDGYGLDAITDGRAKEILQKKFAAEEIPTKMALGADKVIRNPDAILNSTSSSEQGLDIYTFSTYPEKTIVVVEDYYTTVNRLVAVLKERGAKLPDAICVMDEQAKQLIIEKNPDLTDRIYVTGQPAFDQFYKEPTEEIGITTREKLGIKPEKTFISFMGTIDGIKFAEALANEIKKIPNIAFTYRRHPRDNVSDAEYKKIFENAGIETLDTSQLPTSDISCASDIVVTTWSTEGLHAIYRKKPTIHITDRNFSKIPTSVELPLPPVKLEASIGINNISDLHDQLKPLLDKTNSTYKKLQQNMGKQYPCDGKNAARVVGVIKKITETQK